LVDVGLEDEGGERWEGDVEGWERKSEEVG